MCTRSLLCSHTHIRAHACATSPGLLGGPLTVFPLPGWRGPRLWSGFRQGHRQLGPKLCPQRSSDPVVDGGRSPSGMNPERRAPPRCAPGAVGPGAPPPPATLCPPLTLVHAGAVQHLGLLHSRPVLGGGILQHSCGQRRKTDGGLRRLQGEPGQRSQCPPPPFSDQWSLCPCRPLSRGDFFSPGP